MFQQAALDDLSLRKPMHLWAIQNTPCFIEFLGDKRVRVEVFRSLAPCEDTAAVSLLTGIESGSMWFRVLAPAPTGLASSRYPQCHRRQAVGGRVPKIPSDPASLDRTREATREESHTEPDKFARISVLSSMVTVCRNPRCYDETWPLPEVV